MIVHGYSSVENKTVWGIIQVDRPVLHEETQSLIG
ncbi:MAG: DUF86 domain-containing protein [Sedimentisphaerales bacterium]|nr:DUF86 domain-containing protein [Sedimentisphaerales bacterium]